MSAEENRVLARRFMEARVVKRDLNAVDEMLSPDFINHNKLVPGQEPDREDYLRGIAAFHAALSPGRLIVEDQVAGNDKVVTRFIVHAIHDRGELMGVAPTGRELTNRAIVVHRIVEGKIAEEWGMGTIGSTLRKQRLEQEIREGERVEQELRVARSIQQASLPEKVPELEGWQISPFYQPAREVGGDFYDFHFLPDDKLGLVVGDATGKGVPAALVMSTTCGMLQSAARVLGSSSPGEVLAQVNETLLARIPSNMFVTCFYAVLDPESGSLRYANAGHDLPYVRRRGDCEEELSPSSREVRSTPMTATKNNVPPSSTLVMTVLVLRTSPSRKFCTLRSSRSLPEHRAYTPRPATSEKSPTKHFGE
jgi:predicted ester cyclase